MRAGDPAAAARAFVAAGAAPDDPANVARRPFVKICGVTDEAGVLAARGRRRRRDRAQRRRRHAPRARARRGRGARPAGPDGRRRRPPAAGRRDHRRRRPGPDRGGDRRVRPRRRPAERRTSASVPRPAVGRRTWKVLHLPAAEPATPRDRPRTTSCRGLAAYLAAGVGPDPARHRRRAASGRDRHARLGTARRRGRPRGAGHPRRRPRPGQRRRAPCARSRPSGSTSHRASSGRAQPGSVRPRTRSGSPCSSSGREPPATTAPTCRSARRRSIPALLDADGAGRWGMERDFGGRYVPETLMAALEQLETAYDALRQDPVFWAELRELLGTFAGRPTAALPRRSAGRRRPRRGGPAGRRVGLARRRRSRASGCTSSARTSPTPAPTRSTTRSARRC